MASSNSTSRDIDLAKNAESHMIDAIGKVYLIRDRVKRDHPFNEIGMALEKLAKAILIKSCHQPKDGWEKATAENVFEQLKKHGDVNSNQLLVLDKLRDLRNHGVHALVDLDSDELTTILFLGVGIFMELAKKHFPDNIDPDSLVSSLPSPNGPKSPNGNSSSPQVGETADVATGGTDTQGNVDTTAQKTESGAKGKGSHPSPKTRSISSKHSSILARTMLIGSWHSRSEADIGILEEMHGESYNAVESKLRETQQLIQSSMRPRGIVWRIDHRLALWRQVGEHITVGDLESFQRAAMKVLRDGYTGERVRYSVMLRRGIAETLALLAGHPRALSNCPESEVELTVVRVVRKVLEGADVDRWRRLNPILPLLAEAEPGEFLDALATALEHSPPNSNGSTISHTPYLLLALEAAAWSTEHLVPSCRILGNLAAHDKSSRDDAGRRPIHSLSNILLSRTRRTMAPSEFRIRAVAAVHEEQPEVGWELLVTLLQGGKTDSVATRRPSYRQDIPAAKDLKVPFQEFQEHRIAYTELAISWAKNSPKRLADLAGHLDKMFLPSAEKLLLGLTSEDHSEEERTPIWERLMELSLMLQDDDDFKALAPLINTIIPQVEPHTPSLKYRRLFALHSLYVLGGSEVTKSEAAHKKYQALLGRSQEKAVKEIIAKEGMNAILKFAETVEDPWSAGFTLARVADGATEKLLLPEQLGSESRNISVMISAFIACRNATGGLKWLISPNLPAPEWNPEQHGAFLCALPFRKQTWDLTEAWLGQENEGHYWEHVQANGLSDPENAEDAVDKLIKHNRPRSAIKCLREMLYKKHDPDPQRCARALKNAVNSDEPGQPLEEDFTVELIKYLREHIKGSEELAEIEAAYFDMLESNDADARSGIDARLSSDPKFFHALLRLFHGSSEYKPDAKITGNISKVKAWRILNRWSSPPGTQDDGSFDSKSFMDWFKQVEQLCDKHGYKKQAFRYIGQVLARLPKIESGDLWIQPEIAKLLDTDATGELRDSYAGRLHVYSRRRFMPTRMIAARFVEYGKDCRAKAEQAELAGYSRLALSLNRAARGYELEAKRWEERLRRRKP